MKINHTRRDETSSTQDHLKRIVSNKNHKLFDYELVTTRIQSNGFGRKGRSWMQFSQTICFSFTLPKRENITICSAEISLLTIEFLIKQFQFDGMLKWPNDILDKQGYKVAGILIDVIKEHLLIGIGINFGQVASEKNIGEFKASSVSLNKNLIDEDFHYIPRQIYHYILENYPHAPRKIIKEWNAYCSHLNKTVQIKDDNNIIQGVFKGLGENGEALIYTNENKLKSIFNGTLRPAESA